MIWVVQVDSTSVKIKLYSVLVGLPEGKRTIRSRSRIYFTTDGRSVSQYVLLSSSLWDL
jgi:hypothetical protein